jgi:Raf kinase inhibitor-like YbhB/YbcL family protein
MRASILSLLSLAIPAAASANTPASLDVTSTAFANNNPIPAEYTCDGAELPPPLAWSKVPAATKSIAILVEDPDAPKGTFTHWLVTDIPATTTAVDGALPAGAMAAKNDKGKSGYAGPCPPSGIHHYVFHVYALDMALKGSPTRTEFLAKIKGHTLASGQLIGIYQRPAGH